MTNNSIRQLWAAGTWALLACVPEVALACPVCFSAQNEENRAAFLGMTAFLTLLPLGMLGLGLGWVWRRMQQGDEPPPAVGMHDSERRASPGQTIP